MVGSDVIVRFVFLFLSFCLVSCSGTVKAPVTARTGAPDANKPARGPESSVGSLTRGYHVVNRGDTLYSIAWRYGLDYRDIANWNDINKPYVIYPQQVIRLKAPPTMGAKSTAGKKPTSSSRTAKTGNAGKRARQTAKKSNVGQNKKPQLPISIKWHWPVQGRIIRSNSPITKKGMDISGKLGQKIKAAATGDVVYSGSGLLGYGKLIIVKHNDTFLSAYAHNNKILVKEGDRVKAGQQIATMGLGNNGKPLLHFEIRKNGKPVNPLIHLPKQNS